MCTMVYIKVLRIPALLDEYNYKCTFGNSCLFFKIFLKA